MKVNVDASFDVDEGIGRTRVIVRDFHGKFVVASCLCLPYVSEAMAAEAYALREGFTRTKWTGLKSCIMQSDNMQLIETMSGGGILTFSDVAILFDCTLLATSFAMIKYENCNT